MNLLTKMLLYFSVVVFVSSLGFACVIYNGQEVEKTVLKSSSEDLPQLLLAEAIARNVENKYASLRGFLLSGDAVSLENYRRVTAENEQSAKTLLEASRTPESRQLLGELSSLEQKYTETANRQVVAMKQSGNDAQALAAMNGELTTLGRALRQKARDYITLQEEQIKADLQNSSQKAKRAVQISLAAAAFSVVLGLAIGSYAARKIRRQINNMALGADKIASGDLTVQIRAESHDEIGHLAAALTTMAARLRELVEKVQYSSEHLAAASEQLLSGAEHSSNSAAKVSTAIRSVAEGTALQSNASQNVTQTVRNMSDTVAMIAANTDTVSETSTQAAASASEGKAAVERAILQMSNIEKVVSDSASIVGELGQRSAAIGQISDTISGIAAQTNLLALNASIEAARAGEQGRGFAVVADEVRKLAEESQTAAKQISSLIHLIQADTARAIKAMQAGTSEVRRGGEVVDQTGASFAQISQLIERVSAEMGNVSASIQELSGSSQEIVGVVHRMEQISHDSAGQASFITSATDEQTTSVAEIASASKELAGLAAELQAAVQVFRV